MRPLACIFLLCGVFTFEQSGLSQTPIVLPVDKGTLTLTVSNTGLENITNYDVLTKLPSNFISKALSVTILPSSPRVWIWSL